MANCLYNNVELPALPDYNKSKYPYAFIIVNGSDADLFLLSVELYYYTSISQMYPSNYGTAAHYDLMNGAWSLDYEGKSIDYNTAYGRPHWANFNVLNDWGDVFLSASEPIPVSYDGREGMFIGVNGVARKVKSIYIGVDGVARKVNRGYIGVNNVARLFWDVAEVTGGSGGGSGGSDDDADTTVYYKHDGTTVVGLPEEYRPYVEYCRRKFYSGDYAHLAIWNYGDWFAVSFLMDDFRITEYNAETTEMKAVGWVTCGLTRSTEVWTHHDYRTQGSTGGNYIGHVMVSSLRFEYNDEFIYPVPVAYLYNGVRLPKLPEWANNQFPYVVMIYDASIVAYKIIAYPVQPTFKQITPTLGDAYDAVGLEVSGEYKQTWCSDSGWYWYNVDDVRTGTGNVKITAILWSNFNIYTSGGEIHLSGSDPVPVYQTGMYSYNGTILPELPECDDMYVCIERRDAYWTLWCCLDKPSTYTSGDYVYHKLTGTPIYFNSSRDGKWWGMQSTYAFETKTILIEDIVWANHEVLNSDGTVYLAISDPIPV